MRRINSKRRGLSSVIAAAFMFIIVSSALGVTLWSIKQQDSVTNQLLEKTRSKLTSLNEGLDISELSMINNKFNITLSNEGGTPAQIKSIYIINETASPKEQFRYDVDFLVDGRQVVSNVGQALPLVVKNTTSYSVRVVTESGNSATAEFRPASLTPLPMSLYVIPPTLTTGENVTLLYSITNNLTNSDSPLTISPKITSSIACAVGQSCTLTKLSSAPASVVIHKGSTTLIKETYRADGPPDTKMMFNASYTGAAKDNFVIESGSIIVVDLAQSVITSIATAPDIYLILPGPAGDSPDQALWGAVVVNPTSSPMKVSRVLMTAFTGAHIGSTQIVSGPPNPVCQNTSIVPGSGWSCPHDNQIQWKDLAAPQTLQPGESKSFMVRVQPTSLPAGNEEPGATVTATVYTDVGIFTQTGYTVGMTDVNQPLVNVYLTNTTDTSTNGALKNGNMFGHRNGIQPGTNTTFYVAIAEFDTSTFGTGTHTSIETGARLIINVPPGFGNVTITSWNKFVTKPTVTARADGITQLVGVTNERIGDAGQEAAVLAFAAITPSPTTEATYLMFSFIDGTTVSSTQFSAGALAEMALQVDGTS